MILPSTTQSPKEEHHDGHRTSSTTTNSGSRRSSWTEEDDELFEQLIQDLSLNVQQQQQHDQSSELIDYSTIREELTSSFLKDLSKTTTLNNNTVDESTTAHNKEPQEGDNLSERVKDHLLTNEIDTPSPKSTTENNNMENPSPIMTEKKEGIMYDSFREWLEGNRKIIDLEKEEDELHLLELFVIHKERELLKKIISFSDGSHISSSSTDNGGNRVKNLFFRKESSDDAIVAAAAGSLLYCEKAVRSLLLYALNCVIPGVVAKRTTNSCSKKSLLSEFSKYDSYLLPGDSSSDDDEQEDNPSYHHDTERHTAPILLFNYTSGSSPSIMVVENQQQTQSHRVYSTSKYIDKYHEGSNFYEHLKDVIVGGDLESGGSLRAVSQFNKAKKKMETVFGIDMPEESWVHFRNYIRKIVLDHTNQEIKTDSGKNITELSEMDYLKELYPISNEKNKKPSKHGLIEITKPPTMVKSQNEKRRITLAKVKALKLLYGSSGYSESLLVDNFPPLYLIESGYPIFSKESTSEEKKAAIENEMRNLELKLINASNKEEFKWIEYLINYLKGSSNDSSPSPIINLMEDLSEDQWKELELLVEELGKTVEIFNTRSEIPKVIEIPSDQYKIPKHHIVEEPISRELILENLNYDESIIAKLPVNTWKNVLSNPIDLENNKNTSEEVKDVKKQIEERGFSVQPITTTTEELSSLSSIQKITKSDTEWSKLDDLTTVPIVKSLSNNILLNKKPIFDPLANKYKQLKNGIIQRGSSKLFGTISSPPPSNDQNWGIKRLEDDSFKLGDLYSFIVSKSHISTKYALMQTRKIANIFFDKKGNAGDDQIGFKTFSKKIKQAYHELVRPDAKNSSLEENLHNNTQNSQKIVQNHDHHDNRNHNSNPPPPTHNNHLPSTTTTTFSVVDENIWREGELIQLSKGGDVVNEINSIRNSCLNESFALFSNLVNLPEGFDVEQLLSPKTINNQLTSDSSPQNILPRVYEIKEQRFDKISLLHLEKTTVELENTFVTKSLSGVELSEDEKKTLQTLKHKLEEERTRLENVISSDTISPFEQSKLEQLGIYQQSIKSLTSSSPIKQNKESTKDLIELEQNLILDREFRVFDQLLDQMNREQRREVLSYKPSIGGEGSTIIHQHQEAIKNYSKLRSYYNQIVRKDSSIREWQSLTLKEKLAFEKDFRKQSKNESSYDNIVNSVSKMMQSAQFAETFSFISTALAKKKIETTTGQYHNSDLAKLLIESNQKEKAQITNMTREFIQKNGIDQRYKTKLLSKLRKQQEKVRDNHQQNTILEESDIIENEVTKDELHLILSHQHQIQKLFKKERLSLVKKLAKKSSLDNSILTIQESKEDPLFTITQIHPLDYLTVEQLTYFKRLFKESMDKSLGEWRERAVQSTRLFVSPHYLKNGNVLQLDDKTSEGETVSAYEKLTSKVFDINNTNNNRGSTQFGSHTTDSQIYNTMTTTPIFPEVPWQGSFKDLQLLYIKMQLERSNNPHYTRSILQFNDSSPEKFLQRSFWKGVWMLPESLSNFVYTSDPSPIIKMLPPSQPKQVEKKPPPVVTPTQPPPIVTPIIPTIPVPSIQTPPPPLTPHIPPPQMPSIPRIQIPIQRPIIQPPTLPVIQPPSQPTVIPQRSPVIVTDAPIYPRYLLENLNRRLFQ